MTRINSAIPVRCLTDEHLLAEHREIKRLPFCLREAIRTGSVKNIPEKFVLGKGHVTFFLDKQKFIFKRYLDLYNEAVWRRGLIVTNYIHNWDNAYEIRDYWNDYTPTPEERQLLIDRITDRIMHSTKRTWHYFGKAISKEDAVGMLVQNHDIYL